MIETKEELMYGDLVQTREGEIGMIVHFPSTMKEHTEIENHHEPVIMYRDSWDLLKYYNNDLTHESEEGFNIVKVFRPHTPYGYVPSHWDEMMKAYCENMYGSVVFDMTPVIKITKKQLERMLGHALEIVE